jgi:ASC-1-like (ASCH) protein
VGSIPKKVAERLVDGIKTFKPLIEQQKAKDIAEADTVILVTEILADVFGYDKFKEITSEFAVKNKWCDLATKIDEKVQTLIEVKAIGHELKQPHSDQAVFYAANHPTCMWVLLTNGQIWRAYCVTNCKPIEQELVVEIDFLALDHKSEDDLSLLFLFCKEGWAKSAIDEYQTQREALSRYLIGAVLLTEPVLGVVRRELKRVSPDVHIEQADIQHVLVNEVIKRDVLDGEKAETAERKVSKAAKVALRESSA